MSRPLHLTLFAIALGLAGVHAAEACSVACRVSDEREPAFEEARAVFTGRVVAREETRSEEDELGNVAVRVVARLAVDTRWKGASTDAVMVRSRFTTFCGQGASFFLDEEYLVWAYDIAEEPGVLDAGFCSRTALLENAADDLEFLGAPETTDGGCQVCHQPAGAWSAIVLLSVPAVALLRRAIGLGRINRAAERRQASARWL